MKIAVTYSGMDDAIGSCRDQIAQQNTSAMLQATDGLKQDWRNQITGAGLGARLANTVRGKVYPGSGLAIDPAGLVWTKAPKIIDAFNRGVTIVPVNGQRYLAIPTDKVPPAPGGRGQGKMTPLQVEVAFNQDLIIRKEPNGNLLAFVNVIPALSGRGYRVATKKRGAQGRKPQLVLMFTLTRSVTLRQRLDIDTLAVSAGVRLATLIGGA